MRKTLCVAFLSFVLMSLLCATASAANFNDVQSSFWASKEIAWASERGLMNGTTATTFNPTGKTLRGQMTAILYRYAGSPPVEQVAVYSDVTSANYYADAAIWAVENEIMEETRLVSKTMDAGNPISRAEFCTMLLMFSIYSDTYVAPSVSTLFTDTGDLSDTMQWAIEWANCHGIVNGTSTTTFNPHGTLTRAAAAAMLYRYETYVNTNPQLPAEARAKELVEYYACPFPRMIEDALINTFGYSEFVAENAVSAAISDQTWYPFAIVHANDFFGKSPIKPSKDDVKQYLVSSLGFDFDVAEYAIENANIAWTSSRTEPTVDWVSLTDLEKLGFTAFAGWGTIKLNYGTGPDYIMTGLPSEVSKGYEFSMKFNDVTINAMFFSENHTPPNSWFYLDKSNLIDAGILNANGTVSNAIKNGVPQERVPTADNSSSNYYPSTSSGAIPPSGAASVTIPTHSETEGNLVWVPTNGGTKYHSRSGCSQMENPIQVSIETAKAYGYTACGRCY